MSRRGRYYVARVVKINLTQEMLMDYMVNSTTISVGKFDWAITDVVDNRKSDRPYVFGKLSKYAKDGHVTVIDEVLRSQVGADAPNLLEASSPFVYLPEYSGIAFLHVWDGIQSDVFSRRFKSIIEATHDGVLVTCEVDPVADYQAFVTRLSKLEEFTEIAATVYPPNPLFGRLWGDLNDYIKERNASEVAVKEQTVKSGGLKTNLVKLMRNLIKDKNYEPRESIGITDAAILMAADGYGRGKVTGVQDGEEIIVRTSETQISFLFSKEPDHDGLANKAENLMAKVIVERDMRH
jgi:hypothetical protein